MDKTLIMMSDSSNKNDFVNTYPISIGLKSTQYDIVEINFFMNVRKCYMVSIIFLLYGKETKYVCSF